MRGMSETPPPGLDPIAIARTRLQPRSFLGRQRRVIRVIRSAAVWLRRVIFAAVAVGGVSGVIVLATMAKNYAVRSPHLQVRRIDVQGGKRTTRQEILAYAGAELWQPMLALDLDSMALRLRQHPWIGKATIRRQWPNKLHIQVYEHEPVLLVSLGDLYLADAQGQLFKRFEGQDQVNFPVVTGLDREGAVSRNDEVAVKLRTAWQLAQAVAAQGDTFGRLEELHYDDDLGWNLVLQLKGKTWGRGSRRSATVMAPSVRAHLGHRPVPHLGRVAAALTVLGERGQAPEVIWADGARTPERIPVELFADRGEPPAVTQRRE